MRTALTLLALLGAPLLANPAPVGSSTIPEVYDLADNGGTTDYFDVAIDQFDPALGTLTSVELTFASDWTRTYQYENLGPQREFNVTFDAKQGNVPLQMVEVIIGTFVDDLNEIHVAGGTNVGSMASYDGNMDFAGASGATQAITPGWDSTAPVVITDAGVLAALTGTGTFDVDLLLGVTYESPSQCGNCTSNVTTELENVILVVTYNYT